MNTAYFVGNLNKKLGVGINIQSLIDYDNSYVVEIENVTDVSGRKDDTGGSGGSRNKDMYVTVTEIQNLCLEHERTTREHQILKGQSITLKAKTSSDTLCLFMGWLSNFSQANSRSKELTITNITKNISVYAKYTSPTHNSDCYELMNLLSANGRMRILDTLMNIFSFNHEILAKFGNGKIKIDRGTFKKVEFYFNDDFMYDGFAHSHEIEDCFLSGEDLGVFVANFLKYKDLNSVYCDIISWDGEKNEYRIMMLNIINFKTFLNQIRNIEKFNKKYPDFEENIKMFFKRDFEEYFKFKISKTKKYLALSDYLKLYGIGYRLITVSRDRRGMSWGNYDPIYGDEMPNTNHYDSRAKIYDCFYKKNKILKNI